jgi:hypothetical protein
VLADGHLVRGPKTDSLGEASTIQINMVKYCTVYWFMKAFHSKLISHLNPFVL